MRNLSKGEALIEAAGRTLGRTLEIKQLDVCNEESIRACVDSLPEKRVDILSKHVPFWFGRVTKSASAVIHSGTALVFPVLQKLV